MQISRIFVRAFGMEFYTYIWRDAAGVPFYVGKGKGGRSHVTAGRSSEFKAIYSQGGCTVEIADEFILESQAHAHEIELIQKYGRREYGGLLVNKTDGGEGVAGWAPSPETRARISASKIGRPLTPEHRLKISAAGIGRVNKPESTEKTAAAHRGAKRSPETRRRISLAAKGRVVSDEARARISFAGRGRKHSPESVERRAATHRGAVRTPEARARMSAAKDGFTPSAEANAKNSATKRLMGPASGMFKGVSYDSSRARWMASLKSQGKRLYLGRFLSAEAAARAYDAAALAAWGIGNCYLNFPGESRA